MLGLLSRIVLGVAVVLILAACASAPVGVASIDSVSPGSATLGDDVQVRVLGENFAYSPESGSSSRGVQVEVCGAPLTDVSMGATEVRPILLPPGMVVNMFVSGELSGTLGEASVAGTSDVVVTLGSGERLVLPDAFECLDPVADTDVQLEPASWAGFPNESVTFTALVNGEPAVDVIWTVDGGQLIENGHEATWQPPVEPGVYYLSIASSAWEGSAVSELVVRDRVQQRVNFGSVQGVQVTGMDVHADGRVALSAQLGGFGAAYVFDKASASLRLYGTDSMRTYRVQLNDVVWDGDQLLAVGASTYNSADGQSVVVGINPAALVPDVSWLSLGTSSAAEHVAVTADGARFIAGSVAGEADLDTYLARLTPGGSAVDLFEEFGSSGDDRVSGLATGPTGLVYLVGSLAGPEFAGSPVADSAFLLAYDPAAETVVWTTLVDDAVLTDVAVADSGAVYVSGSRTGEAFVARYGADRVPVWEAVLSGWSLATGIAASGTDEVFVTGRQGEAGAFVARLDALGEPVWLHALDAETVQDPVGIGLAADGSVVVAGRGNSDSGIVWLAP